jgi:hypothetical protein
MDVLKKRKEKAFNKQYQWNETKSDPLWSIIVKLLKLQCKERIVKTARQKHQIIYKTIPSTVKVDFSAAETL